MNPIRRDRRLHEESGPVDWGDSRSAGPGLAPTYRTQESRDRSSAGPQARGPGGRGSGARRSSASSTDWGVGRGPAPAAPTPGQRARSPWPEARRRQRLSGILFALVGLALATFAAMKLAYAAEAGYPWVPPWLVAVLGGAGLVSAAGYLAWAGGTAVRFEAQRWEPTVLDVAAGLTVGEVEVADPGHLLDGTGHPRPLLETGRPAAPQMTAEDVPQAPRATIPSGPAPIMGTSTLDQDRHAPAGVAGAVGGFMIAGAVVCAVISIVLGSQWLLGTVALATGGGLALRLAGEWLGYL